MNRGCIQRRDPSLRRASRVSARDDINWVFEVRARMG